MTSMNKVQLNNRESFRHNNQLINISNNFRENENDQQVIPSMPGVYRFGIKKLTDYLRPLVEMGLKSVLLFGVVDTLPKVNS